MFLGLQSTAALPSALGAEPWLARAAFAADVPRLSRLAAQLRGLPLASLQLVKAFDAANDADAFGSLRAPVQWYCERDGCGRIFDAHTTLWGALQLVRAPMSARVSGAGGDESATVGLGSLLAELEQECGRSSVNADAYLTCAAHANASLGWHVDDVDVLLVMLDGCKRFRVAGTVLGSVAVVDHFMEAGDALYIPALTFHSGGRY